MTEARLSPRAREDLLSAMRWIAKDNPSAAQALRDAIAEAAKNIVAYHDIGVLRPELADAPYRFLPLTGFSYLLVYNAERTPPLIIRILHGAQDLPEIFK